jgi:hypothetical protein
MAVGMDADAILAYQRNPKGTAGAWASLSAQAAAYRGARKNKIGFDLADRKHPDDPQKQKA